MIDLATKTVYETAFRDYVRACSQGKLGKAWSAANTLSKCPRGAMQDLAVLPSYYPLMSEYSRATLQCIEDRIMDYNHSVL